MGRREQRHAAASGHSSGVPRVTHRQQSSGYASMPHTSNSEPSLIESLFSLGQTLWSAHQTYRHFAEANAELDRLKAESERNKIECRRLLDEAMVIGENQQRRAMQMDVSQAFILDSDHEDSDDEESYDVDFDDEEIDDEESYAVDFDDEEIDDEAFDDEEIDDEAFDDNDSDDQEEANKGAFENEAWRNRILNMHGPSSRLVVESTAEVAVIPAPTLSPPAATILPASLPSIYYAVSAKQVSKRNERENISAEEALATFKASDRFNVYKTSAKAKLEINQQTKVGNFWGVNKPLQFMITTTNLTSDVWEGMPIEHQQIDMAFFIPKDMSDRELLRSRLDEEELRLVVLRAHNAYEGTFANSTASSSGSEGGMCSTLSSHGSGSSHGTTGLTRATEFKDSLANLEYVELMAELQRYADGYWNGNFEKDRSFKAFLYEELVKKYGEKAQQDSLKSQTIIKKEDLLTALTHADTQIKATMKNWLESMGVPDCEVACMAKKL